MFTVLGVVTTNNSKEKQDIKIGAILALSGSTSSFYGEYNKRAIDIAIEEVNSTGGINGKKVLVQYEDSKGDKIEGVNAFNKLKIEEVHFVISDISSVSVAIGSIAQSTQTVLVATSASSPLITTTGDYVFRTKMAAQHEGVKAADYIVNKIKPKNVAFLYQNSDYGVGVFESFKKIIVENGLTIVSSEKFEKGATDMRTEIIKISKQKPELVIIAGFPKEIGQVLKQAHELKTNLRFFAHSGSIGPDIEKIAGKTSSGLIYLTELHAETREFKDFSEKYVKKYGIPAELFAANAYDAARLILEGLKSCGENTLCVKKYLSSVYNHQGVAGNITFDSNGDIIDRELLCRERVYTEERLEDILCK